MKSPETTTTKTTPAPNHTAQSFFGDRTEAEESFFNPASSDAVSSKPSFFSPASNQHTTPAIQPKLTIGAPNDPHEKEADSVADQVVQRLATAPTSPSSPIQLKSAETAEEKLQEKPEEPEQQEGLLQAKPVFDSAAPPPEEQSLQRKCAECEQEESENIQRKESGGEATAPANLGSRLQSSRGGGSSMPQETRKQMESAMDADFSNVRVHTDHEAVDMSQGIQAQAFTHGSDVYFNEGKYDPGSTDGQRLLAHELTHTVQQSGDVNLKVQRNAATTTPTIKPVNKVGIVNRDRYPLLKLRSSPDTTSDNVIGILPFNTTLQIMEEHEGGWYKISTVKGEVGYVAKDYIWMHLPEPNAKLHRVEAGENGYAINIAAQYYKWDFLWGRDARFYVAVLAVANKKKIADTRTGWKETHFEANDLIWIPSGPFAKSLVGKLQSGSLSYDVLDTIGLAGIIQAIDQKLRDFQRAVTLSGKYLKQALINHAKQGLINGLMALASMIVMAIGVLAVSTAIGAAIGALFGGVGAGPGAAIGFEIGLIILEWMGLAFLAKWIMESMAKIGSAFWKFIKTVWSADGDKDTIEKGAQDFAEAIGTMLEVLIEAIVVLAATYGIGWVAGKLKSTKFGEKIGLDKFEIWLKERVEGAKQKKKTIAEQLKVMSARSGSVAKSALSRINIKVSDFVLKLREKGQYSLRSGGGSSKFYEGPARTMHEARFTEIIDALDAAGVEVIVHDGMKPWEGNYTPSSQKGTPGNIRVHRDVDLRTLEHEYKHYLDDKGNGFPGLSHYIKNPKEMYLMEKAAYEMEMEMVRQNKSLTAEEQGKVIELLQEQLAVEKERYKQ